MPDSLSDPRAPCLLPWQLPVPPSPAPSGLGHLERTLRGATDSTCEMAPHQGGWLPVLLPGAQASAPGLLGHRVGPPRCPGVSRCCPPCPQAAHGRDSPVRAVRAHWQPRPPLPCPSRSAGWETSPGNASSSRQSSQALSQTRRGLREESGSTFHPGLSLTRSGLEHSALSGVGLLCETRGQGL